MTHKSNGRIELLSRGVLTASPFLGAALIAGYIVSGFGGAPQPPNTTNQSPPQDLASAATAVRIVASHGAIAEYAAERALAAATPEPVVSAAAAVEASGPQVATTGPRVVRKKLEHVVQTKQITATAEPANVSVAAVGEPEQNGGLLAKSWNLMTTTSGAAVSGVLEAPRAVWRKSRSIAETATDAGFQLARRVSELRP